jgi:hypothetical protein
VGGALPQVIYALLLNTYPNLRSRKLLSITHLCSPHEKNALQPAVLRWSLLQTSAKLPVQQTWWQILSPGRQVTWRKRSYPGGDLCKSAPWVSGCSPVGRQAELLSTFTSWRGSCRHLLLQDSALQQCYGSVSVRIRNFRPNQDPK